ncbi:MAG TPA: D-arabinono-1,4-lactone oxidase [Thermomicrobiales bacterium]|nr:D-arabinono-1,4-lactone oxidase [Thermomicrobiales bacterium]
MAEMNWAGNLTYRAGTVHKPATLDELRRIVAKAAHIRPLGTRHCFNDIADSDELVSLAEMASPIDVDTETMTVTVGGGVRYGELARELVRHDMALHAMASLPHISVAGAIATATHGSGDACGNLATVVSALEMVGSEGDIIRVERSDDNFAGMVVGLGALGVVTRVTLDVLPGYMVRQDVFVDLPWETLFARFDDVTSAAESVSLFTDYGETVNQVWLKRRIGTDESTGPLDDFMGAIPATESLHPATGAYSGAVTEQMGVPGLWCDRLPHFRLDATPSSGDEVQSEYFVLREHAVAALTALRGLADRIQPLLQVSEIRTIAADDQWMSMAYGQDSVAMHFTWKPDEAAVREVLPAIEDALAPFSPRPHWGKVFVATAKELDPRYPRMDDFRALALRLDPREVFRNRWYDRVIG